MIKFVLASHGKFAEGIYDSVKIIMGEQKNITVLCAYIDERSDLKKQVLSIINGLSPEDKLIVITDIFGGSVNNEFMSHVNKRNIHIVAGLNLPLLLELISRQEEADTVKMIEESLRNSKEYIQYCNKTLSLGSKVKDEEF